MVYYRKYRPQTIGELDNPNLGETLYAVLSSREVPHAFLFTGPKGLGKTSTARIVAKVLNCAHDAKGKEKRAKEKSALSSTPSALSSIEPDNICEQCISIMNGTNIDVLEIDGASNRGIDEIRELRERVRLAPSLAKKKVYIIDEVHMLTTEAFNALLKTIEEPPAHAVFIFCTTEAHKVPSTILSRCFHVSFTLATDEELVRALERIVKGENLNVEKEALSLIAHLAEGGFRDATKMLEEMVALSAGKEITKKFVEEKLKVSDILYFVSTMCNLLVTNNTKECLRLVQQISENGMDTKYFLGEMLEFLHSALLSKAGIQSNFKYPISNIQFQIEDIQQLVKLFSEAYLQTKTAIIPTLPLEIAIIQYTTTKSVILEEGESRLSSLSMHSSGSQEESQQEHAIVSPAARDSHQHDKLMVSSGPTIDSLKRQQHAIKVKNMLYPEKKEEPKKQVSSINAEQSDIASTPTDANIALLENLLYKVKPLNASIAGVLRGSKVKEITDTHIILEANYKFHKEKLEEAKTCEIIEKAIREITGKNLKVQVTLKLPK